MTITTEFKKVSPELAKQFLETMGNNRRLKERKVRELVKAMKDGKFRKTHQGIAFSPSGVLIDGQHRLQAIIRSGETIELNVSFGVEEDTLHAVDVGTKRSAADLYEFLGGDKNISANMMAIARACLNGCSGAQVGYDHQLLVDFAVENHSVIHRYLKMGLNVNLRSVYRAPWVASFVMAALVYGEDRIDPLMERMAGLNFYGDQDPIKLLFTALLNAKYEKTNGRRSMKPQYLYGLTVSAINLLIEGKNKKQLRRGKNDLKGSDLVRQKFLGGGEPVADREEEEGEGDEN